MPVLLYIRIMSDYEKNINLASVIARRSHNKKHKTGCVIAYPGDEVISTGWSHSGVWCIGDLYSVHSEIHAILRGRHVNLEGCVAYISTLTKSGKRTSAKPCVSCATALVAYGIDYAICTTSTGDIEVVHLLEAIDTLKEYRKRA